MSSFSSIGSLSNALRAFQREMDVTGQNVANVDTPGYSRQRVNLKAEFTSGFPFPTGNGVSVASVSRTRDLFLEGRRNEVASDMGRFDAQSQGMSRVEAVVYDPTTAGIGDALDKFFDSWSGLSSNPASTALRNEVLSSAETLASRMRTVSGELSTLRDETQARIGAGVARVNELGATIANLNEQIRRSGGAANELLDQRDAALTEIASLVDVKTALLGDGTITVSVNQLTLVSGADAMSLPGGPIDPTTGTLGTGDRRVEIRGGGIRGEFDVLNSLTNYSNRLDRLADSVRTAVNGVHSTGPRSTPFFTGSGAAAFAVDPAVKGRPDAIDAGATTAAADGSLAIQLSKLRDNRMVALGGRTVSEEFADIVASVGRDAKTADDSRGLQASLASQLDAQIQSVSGVSLDDEMANMLRFQRSYQAAARALSTFDSTFDDLLGMLR
jgi:flagellar hook-associated protein 1 FlgK